MPSATAEAGHLRREREVRFGHYQPRPGQDVRPLHLEAAARVAVLSGSQGPIAETAE